MTSHAVSTEIGDDWPDAGLAVPDQDLRWRVTGSQITEFEFRDTGRQSVADLQRVLQTSGKRLDEFTSVLDFGCGCGRVLRHLRHLAGSAALHGCDTDGDAVAWAREHLDFATYEHNDALPPLPYDDATFDLVANHSVFTHLPEAYQDRWLAELQRVLAPGGWAVLSVAGLHAFAGLVQSWRDWPADPSHLEAAMRDVGFLYISDDSWTGTSFPDWYHSTFHSPNYVIEHWSQYFTVVGYFPRAALNFQDVVLVQRARS
jgi:SAM-dependent methyltransferase